VADDLTGKPEKGDATLFSTEKGDATLFAGEQTSPEAGGVPSSDAPVALVTGARKGIGRYLAERLLGQGYAVVGCSRNPCEWSAPGFAHREVDVADEKQVVGLMRFIAQTYGRLDVVLNNAGVASMNHILLTPVSTLEKMLRVNVAGTFLVSREAAKLMRKRKFGRIVNFSSAVVPLHLSGEAAYIASKAGVEALSQAMAREVAELGITVNVVGPGPTDTDMIRGVPKAKMEKTLQLFAIPRLTTLDDIGNAVDFFVRPASEAVTGQVLYLNGGR
jgi:3-oxoacyl-[acyl-carrier protein] reductase